MVLEGMAFKRKAEGICGILVQALMGLDLRLLYLFTILLLSAMNAYEDCHVLLEHVFFTNNVKRKSRSRSASSQ